LIIDFVIRALDKTLTKHKEIIYKCQGEIVPQGEYQKLFQRFKALTIIDDETNPKI